MSVDPSDNLTVSVANPWAKEKHRLLAHYVDASWGARKNWPSHAYVDLFCGPGRQVVKGTTELIDGSPLCAWRASQLNKAPFTKVVIADVNEEYVEACSRRLMRLGAPVVARTGSAKELAGWAAGQLDSKRGLNLVFADPYNLDALPFSVFEVFTWMPHVDIIAHFHEADLTRNLVRYIRGRDAVLDRFAPAWRDVVPHDAPTKMRVGVLRHWASLFTKEGFITAKEVPLFKNSKKTRLYRLVHFSRSPHAAKLWNSVATKQISFGF